MNIQIKTILSFLALVNLGSFILCLPSNSSEYYCSINSRDGCKGSEELSDKFFQNYYSNNGFLDDNLSLSKQLKNYFGINGYRDSNMQKDALNVWEVFTLESAKQSSGPRKHTQDIPNGYNGSLLKF